MMGLFAGYEYAPITAVVDSVFASITAATRGLPPTSVRIEKPLFAFNMPPIPIQRTKDNAIAWARDCIRENERWINPKSDISVLHHYYESLLAYSLVRDNEEWSHPAVTPLCKVVMRAKRGDRIAFRACRMAAAWYLQLDRPMPPLLREFASCYLKATAPNAMEPKKGGDPDKNRMRDKVIFSIVAVLRDKFGIYPARNEARHHLSGADSGCSIVASLIAEKGLNLSESAIEKIWNRSRIA